MELFDALFAHDVQGQALSVPWSIDYFSVVVGALTGALFACDRKLDIIGTVVLGLLTGYGGGIMRDMLMQDRGVYFTSHPDLIVICIVICVFVFYFRGLFRHLDATVFFADALSVGLFALAGASKAFANGEGFVLSVILGGITAVGGGAMRDICVGETPGIFQQSNFYAVAGLGGSFVFVTLAYAGCPLPIAGVACVFAVTFLRYWSVYFDWRTASEADLTPHVARGVGKVRRVAAGVFLHGGDATARQRRLPRLLRRHAAGGRAREGGRRRGGGDEGRVGRKGFDEPLRSDVAVSSDALRARERVVGDGVGADEGASSREDRSCD
ncbi:hypothetical protein B5F40_02500 [Gordonibacter sp. An230]|uniref:trimeric intracellular cation channel family protein n=1 Tax=Gordonibacter sp. An230 TaxID=1965592 RepID=UPI000B37FA59|nr:TRIC cation channel family protein [Gordonibacter sp. An230]OUO91728.1 hypothetical protein B5F40_02500 [Gordonibacter sp. An230]